MTVDFQDNFWSDKQNGFDILYQNLKCGSTAGKELAEFYRTRSFMEEYNVNFLLKLGRKTNNLQYGTFQPLWQLLKSSTEKLSSLHMQTFQRLNQLIKEVNKYCEEHHRKQKQVKTEENPTIEVINELKETLSALNKAKEFYFAKTIEIDRLRRENASQKDIEKAEVRVNKACVEYKVLIEKYQKVKDDYERKFSLTCQNFQRIEQDHLKQMKDYIYNYYQILESGHTLIGQVYKEFQSNCNEMSIEKLLEAFVKSKGTGNTRPVDIQFEEANLSAVQLALPSIGLSSNSSSSLNQPTVASSTSASSRNASNSYSSSLDLINFDPIAPITTNNVSSSAVAEGGSIFASVFESNFTSSSRKEGDDHTKKASHVQSGGDDIALASIIGNSQSDNLKDHHKSFPDVRVNSHSKPTKWFLRGRKSKKGKGRKESDDDESNNGSISGSKLDLRETNQSSVTGNSTDFYIDSEGFTVRSTQAPKAEEDDFDSSSDTDSEDEKEKKIFVKINPLKNGTQISASVDQLIASAGALAPPAQSNRRANFSANPSPVLNDNSIKRSVSATHTAFKSKEENDLFNVFDLQGKSDKSNGELTAKPSEEVGFSRPRPQSTQSAALLATDRYAALSELFSSQPPTITSSSSSSSTTVTTETNVASTEPVPSSVPKTTESNIPPLPPKSNLESSGFNVLANSSSLSKSISSSSIIGNNSFSVYKPLSKSFASYSQNMSSSNMSRADSLSSLSSDFRMTPISLCSSRDSSPLTIGMSDIMPVAVAFQESVSACFKGTEETLCKINIIGCIKIAFSSGIIQILASNPYLPQLSFKLKNLDRLDRLILSKELVTQVESNDLHSTYEFNMNALQSSLKRQYEQSPNNRYYNLDIFKYQLRTLPGAKNAPLQLVSYWKCEEKVTNLKIDFKYNPSAFMNGTVYPLRNVQFTANVDGNVQSMASQPEGKWDTLTKQATWRYNEISQSTENAGLGSIKAKFDLFDGTTCPSSVYVQFASQDATLSGLEFELVSSGYRLTLIKRQFSSGRYYCEPKV